MPHVAEHCSANFCFNYIGRGVRLVVKAILLLWPPATVCLLQRRTALHRAAAAGHVAVVKTLLLSGADPGARSNSVSRNSSYRFESCRIHPLYPCLICSMSVQGHW